MNFRNVYMSIPYIIGIVLLTGCTKMVRTEVNPYPQDTVKNRIDYLANDLIRKKENMGFVIATYQNKKTSIYAYGKNNRITDMNKDNIFAIGSVTKSMVISLLLVLEDKGLVSLDDTIGNILPQSIYYKDPTIKDIKLSELAIHTSGLPREPLVIESLYPVIKYLFTGDNIYDYLDEEFMYDYLSTTSIGKVHTKAVYSNIGIALLANLLEIKMNESLDELLVKHIFSPLKMNNTTFTLKNEQLNLLAQGHVGDFPLFMTKNEELENWNLSGFMKSSGGLYSNVHDLLNFVKAHLGVSNSYLDGVFTKSHTVLSNDDKLSYTYGWQIEYIKEQDMNLYYKYGLISGYSCYIGMELKSKTAIIVLKNNFNWSDKIGHQILIEMAQKNFTLNVK